MNTANTTPSLPLSAEQPNNLVRFGFCDIDDSDFIERPDGPYVRYEDHAALIAQARTAQQATASSGAQAPDDERAQQLLPPWPEPINGLAHERETVAPWLSDKDIVDALHSLGIDTEGSKYGFGAIQVCGSSVPLIRRLVDKLANRASSAKPDLLGEIMGLASLGMSYGLLADDYCSQIVAKIEESQRASSAPVVGEDEQANWRDALRLSKAKTDSQGIVRFTPGQLEHFMSMVIGGWLPNHANTLSAKLEESADELSALKTRYGMMKAAYQAEVNILRRRAAPVNISDLVTRFLGWPLPTKIASSLCHGIEIPIGTHLMTSEEAKAMFDYCLASPAATPASDTRAAVPDVITSTMIAAGMLNRSHIDGESKEDAEAETVAIFKAMLAAAPIAAIAEADAKDTQTQAARDVLAERRRQVEQEGWTPAHDDQYQHGEMARAAACYASINSYPTPSMWPWAPEWWKPRDFRSNYVRASALLLAEIERIDRAAMSATQQAQNSAKGSA